LLDTGPNQLYTLDLVDLCIIYVIYCY